MNHATRLHYLIAPRSSVSPGAVLADFHHIAGPARAVAALLASVGCVLNGSATLQAATLGSGLDRHPAHRGVTPGE